MSIKQTKEYVKNLGTPFTDIYQLVGDFIMEHESDEDGWELMAKIEDVFTKFAELNQ
jgi:hypothetical protein